MPKVIAHVNGVNYELQHELEGAQAQQLAENLATRDGDSIQLDVLINGRAVHLTVVRELIWTSGVTTGPGARSVYEDGELLVV